MSWVALHNSEERRELQKRHPNAFLLLCQIASRARWKDEPCSITGLRYGQALIGDWRDSGLSSEKAYRHAKRTLARVGQAEFRGVRTGANRGTVATLSSSAIFSIAEGARGDRVGGKNDSGGALGGHSRGGRTATNHTEHRGTQHNAQLAETIVGAYPRREDVTEALKEVARQLEAGADAEAMLAGTRSIAAVIRSLPSGPLNCYVPGAFKFFQRQRWRDDPETFRRQAAAKANGGAKTYTDEEAREALGGRI